MEKEISTGAMLGIVLIALSAIIGLSFMIFMVSKNTANKGAVDIQDNQEMMLTMFFREYDQKHVTGYDVRAALTTLRDRNYAVLVNTKFMNEKVVSQKSKKGYQLISFERIQDMTYDSGLLNPNGVVSDFINFNTKLSWDGTSVSDIKSTKPVYLAQYNNPLTEVFTNDVFKGLNETNHIYYEDGYYYSNYTFGLDENNNVERDTDFTEVYLAGDALYLNGKSEFIAHLLKNPAGNIIGIVCEQVQD